MMSIDSLVQSAIQRSNDSHLCCKDGVCNNYLCVVHNKEGVRNIVNSGAARISASIGVEEGGGVDNDIARMIDHTLLKPEATISEVEKLCAEAKKYSFASVCINPSYVSLSSKLLKDTPVKVCTVIGFPLGATSTQSKVAEEIGRAHV